MEGQLFGVESKYAQVNGCFFEPETNSLRLAIVNPSRTPDSLIIKPGSLTIAKAEIVNPEGIAQKAVPIVSGKIDVDVPARDFAFLRITPQP